MQTKQAFWVALVIAVILVSLLLFSMHKRAGKTLPNGTAATNQDGVSDVVEAKKLNQNEI
ncbi:MAG: hypothetical protein LLF76_04530 [Planctomycetaceae bacterium]|nr:hypothetical protein [Planctomycetaceae bacterium]